MMKNFLCFLILLLSFEGHAAKRLISEGPWRFEMRATYAVIPFIIELKYGKRNQLMGTLRNGKETIRLRGIVVKDNLIKIPLQDYENALELNVLNKETLQGEFVRYNKNPEVRLPVAGKKGGDLFLVTPTKPAQDLSGTWAVKMTEEDGKVSQGIILFEQKGNKLNGSILSPTGDYRYFEGYVDNENFEVASFDGVYNYTFKGRVEKDKIEASIMANWKTSISGVRDAKAKLPDAYKQTQLDKMKFSFPDINGKTISLDDAAFAGKAVVVSFYGTWCPNCVDETNYLIPWYRKNKRRGVEVVALAFERSLTLADARMQLTKVVKKAKIPYTVLLAGSTSEDKPMDKIPGLKNFISFPTTVFLNKKHEVVKVHAGFTGPSTGKFYEEWKTEFNHDVDEILK